jgi:hypothetical protein
MTRPEPRRSPPRPGMSPPRPGVYPPRASPENQERAPGPPRPPRARPARPPAQHQPPEDGPGKRRPVFPGFFLAVQVLFLVLVIAAALAADHGTAEAISHQVARTCLNGAWRGAFASQRACLASFHVTVPAGQDLDPGLSPGLVAIAWVVADACLVLGYGLYRLARARR